MPHENLTCLVSDPVRLVGEVVKKPVVIDDEVVVWPMLTIIATVDHRYVDGFHASCLATSVREYLGDPGRFEPA